MSDFSQMPSSLHSIDCYHGFKKFHQEEMVGCCFDCAPCSENEQVSDYSREKFSRWTFSYPHCNTEGALKGAALLCDFHQGRLLRHRLKPNKIFISQSTTTLCVQDPSTALSCSQSKILSSRNHVMS